MSSAIGAAFTYLLTQIPVALATVDASAVVVDGPVALYEPPPPAPMVYVGAHDPLSGQALDGTRMYVQLGAMKADEDFTIPCYIEAVTGNADQSECRNAALAVLDAIVHLIHSDLTLGGVLLGGRIAEVTNVQVIQTETEEEADNGRRCLIPFTVHCANHYTP